MKQFQLSYIHKVIFETEISVQSNARFQTWTLYFRDNDAKCEYIFCFGIKESNLIVSVGIHLWMFAGHPATKIQNTLNQFVNKTEITTVKRNGQP